MDHQEIELLLDEVYDAFMTRDRDRLGQAVDLLSTAPPVVPDVITRRLIDGREPAPGLMLMILMQIAPDRHDIYLQRIIKARDASDQVRYEAHLMLGWDEQRELKQRRGFLKKLRDPFGTLASSVNTAGRTWPGRIEPLSDVEAFLRAIEPPERYDAFDRIVELAGWNALPLLHGLIHADDPVIQQRSVEALASYRCTASLAPLRRLARTARIEDVRRQVEEVFASVSFDRQSAPEGDEPMFPAGDLPPLVWARVTRVSPDGNQALWVARQVSEGFYDATNIRLTGHSGLSEVIQYGPMSEDVLNEDVLAIEGDIAPWTTIDLPVARGLLDYAVDRYAEQTDLAIPFVLELYAPMLHDSYPPSPDEPAVVPILDETPYANRSDLVARGAALIEHPLFNEWAFEIDHLLHSLAMGPLSALERSDAEVVLTLSQRLLDEPSRAVLRDALRRQAWLLEAAGSNDERDIALALAAWICGASNEELSENAFIGTLMQTTLSVAFNTFDALGMLDDIEGLDEDWLDEFNPEDESIELDWTAGRDEGHAGLPGR